MAYVTVGNAIGDTDGMADFGTRTTSEMCINYKHKSIYVKTMETWICSSHLSVRHCDLSNNRVVIRITGKTLQLGYITLRYIALRCVWLSIAQLVSTSFLMRKRLLHAYGYGYVTLLYVTLRYVALQQV